MPRPHPLEFRRRAVELANQRDENGNRLLDMRVIVVHYRLPSRRRCCSSAEERARGCDAVSDPFDVAFWGGVGGARSSAAG